MATHFIELYKNLLRSTKIKKRNTYININSAGAIAMSGRPTGCHLRQSQCCPVLNTIVSSQLQHGIKKKKKHHNKPPTTQASMILCPFTTPSYKIKFTCERCLLTLNIVKPFMVVITAF